MSTKPTVDEICYGDWYLPSKIELNLLYQYKNEALVAGFADYYYWSYTEGGSSYTWYQDFYNGKQNYFNKNYTYLRARAVRAF